MNLHCDKEQFEDAIMATSSAIGFEPALIEKDYFVTLFLKKATEMVDGLVFKGGTSLSKCYKLIDRFSEDIDLTLDERHFGQKNKRKAVKGLVAVCDAIDLELDNREEVMNHSHGNLNTYYINYPTTFESNIIKPGLIIEMAYMQRAFPYEVKKANSYIGEYFARIGALDIIKNYGLDKFDVKAQVPERTLIDKVFALCDYYLAKDGKWNSRHIYDLFKLLSIVNIESQDFKQLVERVRVARMPNRTCLSAQEDADVQSVLSEIIKSEFYKSDYEKITEKTLSVKVGYEDAIESLNRVISSGAFNRNDNNPQR